MINAKESNTLELSLTEISILGKIVDNAYTTEKGSEFEIISGLMGKGFVKTVGSPLVRYCATEEGVEYHTKYLEGWNDSMRGNKNIGHFKNRKSK